jgi:Na+-driven multidrug efflux pump
LVQLRHHRKLILVTHLNKFILSEIVNKIVLLINLIVLVVIVKLVITIRTVSALGTAACAAWGVLGALWEALEGVTSAIGNAAVVRVGCMLCAGRPREEQSSAYKPLYFEMFATVLDTSCSFMTADNIPTWMTNDKTLQRMQLFGIGNTSVQASGIIQPTMTQHLMLIIFQQICHH